MIRLPVTILSTDTHLCSLLHGVLQEKGYLPYVPSQNAALRPPMLTGLVIEQEPRRLLIYPRNGSRKARASAAEIPYPPLDIHEFITVVNRRGAEIRRESTRASTVHHHSPTEIIHAPDSPMRDVLRQIALYGPQPESVLVTGETGTGKELVVRALHAASPRAGRSLVMINCASLPELLLESELFGHTKGSFTGAHVTKLGILETAHGGTAVLDEVNSMSLPLQAKLLRFLQHGEVRRVGDNHTSHVDVRILATTNQSLPALIAARQFRADLYYRLNIFEIEVPPLRDRRMDLPLLVEHFGGGKVQINAADNYRWPGNVRELENHVRRALVIHGQKPASESDQGSRTGASENER